MAPVGRIVVIAVVYAFMAVYLVVGAPISESELGTTNPNAPDNPDNSSSGTFGFLTEGAGIVKTVIDFLSFFWSLFSFDIPGVPTVVRFILSLSINGTLLWDSAALIRGGGN